MTDTRTLTDTWQERFDFYDRFGLPSSTPEARDAYKQLPLWTRMRMGFNALAFLFGPLYFFAKGMWRKGLVLLIAALALGTAAVLLDPPQMIDRALSLVIPALAATTASYGYYLHVVMESRSWNPFEGFGRKSTR